MSERRTDFQKYKGNLHNKLTIKRAFKNEIFGGSFVYGLNNGKISDSSTLPSSKFTNVKTNYVKKAIYATDMRNQNPDTNLGYYVLQNVRISARVFWDI